MFSEKCPTRCSQRWLCLFMCLACLLGVSGCATYRGMPSHGGGKRFDEEQRVVAAAIRHAAQQMDLSALAGKQIALEITNLETTGTGQPFYSGLGNVQLLGSYVDTDSFINRVQRPGAVEGIANPNNNYNSDDGNDRREGRVTANYQFNPSLRTNNNITRQDIEYLKRVLQMRLHHEGFQVVGPPKADALLVVLVDVLGTNLSRVDYGVAYRDDLGASCEMTYYAINAKNQVVLSPSKSVGSSANYEELNVRFTPFRTKDRTVESIDSTIIPLPTDTVVTTEAGDVGIRAGADVDRDARVDALYQEAIIQIESNNRSDARQVIQGIRALDPSFQSLPELEQKLAEM